MFHNLDTEHSPEDALIAKGLRALRDRIDLENIPPSKLDESLNLATWNIRDFGKTPRSKAGLHYIAEILYQFDLIAVTELRAELGDLERVKQILGPYWKVVFSDFGMDRAGNRERVAYLYDSRMVEFTGLAAEADEPRKKNQHTGRYEDTEFEWWRSPYMASFRAGNFDFMVLAVHIRWGKDEHDRLPPIKGLAEWLKKRVKDKGVFDKDIIVVGDFNIPSMDSDLYKPLKKAGWEMPDGILRASRGSNLNQNARYDQILVNKKYTSLADPVGGDIDFFHDDFRALFPAAQFPDLTKTKFTYEVSDHLPLWIQLDTWSDDEVLDQAINQAVTPG